jgi:co-chaperonin GroES (HSP10)
MKRYKIPRVVGTNILVEVCAFAPEIKEQAFTSDAIHIPSMEEAKQYSGKDEQAIVRAIAGSAVGKVISCGSKAFLDIEEVDDVPELLPGQYVTFPSYAGTMYSDPATHVDYRIMQIRDVIAVIGEE